VTAGELMTSRPVTIGPDEPVEQAAFLMYDRGIKRLPVVDEAGHLIGIVSRADVLSVYARPDDDIWREVTDQVILRRLPGGSGALRRYRAERHRDPVRTPGNRPGWPADR